MLFVLGRIVFIAVAFSVLGLLHYYLYRRLAAPAAGSRKARRIAAAVCAGLALLLVTAMIVQRAEPGPVTTFVARTGYIWMALALYLFFIAVALDGVRFAARLVARVRRHGAAPADPPNPARRLLLARAAAAGATGVAAGATGYGFWRAYEPPLIHDVSARLPNLPRALSGLTIAQLTDIHVGPWIDRPFIEDLVARTNALRPDLVAITGDLVDGTVQTLLPAVAPLANLRSRYGTFFVNGNHEYYSGVEEWVVALRQLGIDVLRNEARRVGDAGASFDLAGVEDWSARRQGFEGRGYDLEAALNGSAPERATVLLAHQPRGFEKAAQHGVGLQISGHTHGGQLFPWTFVVELAYHPYAVGLASLGASSIFVSRGCGFWGPPVRVAAPPEIARISLI